ncbi:MAG: flagellar basal body-associated FliL family protein [Planctomycetota bacterium]
MADAKEDESKDAKKSGGMLPKLIIWGVVFVVGVGSGAVVPMMMMPAPDGEAAEPLNYPETFTPMDIPEADENLAYISFDEVVVNLNDVRYSRYVTCEFSLQIAKSQEAAIQKLVDDNKDPLINWLIAHLRDKKLEDVRGKLGHNALRREIHDKFNEMLFTDGIERIQDVLFRDFKVQ